MTDGPGTEYHYTECGLDGVYLVFSTVMDSAGEETITIENVHLLHEVLREAVAWKGTGLDNKEIRFLRTGLGLTQAELATLLHKDAQTVGRWERGETPIDGASETLLRAMVLRETCDPETVRRLAALVSQTSVSTDYTIDASDPNNYRPLAA